MEQKQKEFVDFLKSLVHTKTNVSSLQSQISEYLKEDIIIEDVSGDETELSDYLLFQSQKEDTYGYFDIYYLKMMNQGLGGSNIYITEVNYEFE